MVKLTPADSALLNLAMKMRYPASDRVLSGDLNALSDVWINRQLILSCLGSAAIKKAVKKGSNKLQRLCMEYTDALEHRDGVKLYEFMGKACRQLNRIAKELDGARYEHGLFVADAYRKSAPLLAGVA